jgi:hypothetical protein
MSADVEIVGIIANNTVKHQAMLEMQRLAVIAGIPEPKEVQSYFNDEEQDDVGQRVSIDSAVTGDAEYEDGAVIHLQQLPKNVTHIRVFMS